MSLDEWLRVLFSALHTVGFECGSELGDPFIPDALAWTAELGPAQTPRCSNSISFTAALHIEYFCDKKKTKISLYLTPMQKQLLKIPFRNLQVKSRSVSSTFFWGWIWTRPSFTPITSDTGTESKNNRHFTLFNKWCTRFSYSQKTFHHSY